METIDMECIANSTVIAQSHVSKNADAQKYLEKSKLCITMEHSSGAPNEFCHHDGYRHAGAK